MRRPVLALLLALTGCTVDLHDEPGRACDLAHPCGANRTCQGGFCLAPKAPDGGPAPMADGGAPAADGGNPLVAPTWNQLVHGFSGTTLEPGCSLVIDPSRGNRLSVTVGSPDDGHDSATGDVTDPARLPATLEGRLRGRLTLAGPLGAGERAVFAWLGTQTGRPWLALSLDEAGQLRVDSAAQTLGPAALEGHLSVDGGFGPGDFIVDVTYRQGGVLRVVVNGDEVGKVPLPLGGATVPPAELRLGIDSFDADGGAGLGLILTSWQLVGDADANLGALP